MFTRDGERSDGKCAVAGGTYSCGSPADESPEMTEGYEGFYHLAR